jgi:hypothetical protein
MVGTAASIGHYKIADFRWGSRLLYLIGTKERGLASVLIFNNDIYIYFSSRLFSSGYIKILKDPRLIKTQVRVVYCIYKSPGVVKLYIAHFEPVTTMGGLDFIHIDAEKLDFSCVF